MSVVLEAAKGLTGNRGAFPFVMPVSAPKPCKHAGCAVLVRDGSERCAAHKLQPWAKRADVKRQSGRALQRKRSELFAREPLCRVCSAKGFVTIATLRDHIKPLAEGGTDDDDNIQPLCVDCHDEKSMAERLRARGVSKV